MSLTEDPASSSWFEEILRAMHPRVSWICWYPGICRGNGCKLPIYSAIDEYSSGTICKGPKTTNISQTLRHRKFGGGSGVNFPVRINGKIQRTRICTGLAWMNMQCCNYWQVYFPVSTNTKENAFGIFLVWLGSRNMHWKRKQTPIPALYTA